MYYFPGFVSWLVYLSVRTWCNTGRQCQIRDVMKKKKNTKQYFMSRVIKLSAKKMLVDYFSSVRVCKSHSQRLHVPVFSALRHSRLAGLGAHPRLVFVSSRCERVRCHSVWPFLIDVSMRLCCEATCMKLYRHVISGGQHYPVVGFWTEVDIHLQLLVFDQHRVSEMLLRSDSFVSMHVEKYGFK